MGVTSAPTTRSRCRTKRTISRCQSVRAGRTMLDWDAAFISLLELSGNVLCPVKDAQDLHSRFRDAVEDHVLACRKTAHSGKQSVSPSSDLRILTEQGAFLSDL